MSFYDKFLDLCNRRGVTPSRAAQEAGISRSLPSKWKKYPNTAPSTDIMKQISRYFGVSVNELLSDAAYEAGVPHTAVYCQVCDS